MANNALVVTAQQNGWLLKPDTDTHVNRMDIRGKSINRRTGKPNLYTVAQTKKSGIWTCECLGYRGNKRKDAQGRRWCQHLDAIVPVFEAMLSAPTTTRRITGR